MRTFLRQPPRRRNGTKRRRRARLRPPDLRRRATFETLESRAMLSANVLTWHNDVARTGLNSNETMLTPSNVGSGTFGQLLSYPVQGQVYAQPLYVSNLAIPGKGTHNVIFVVTENNDVYALDANSNAGASAGVIWHVNLGPAAASPSNYFGTATRYGPYHDINPQVGITSTPVIDLSTDTMYIDDFTNDATGQYSHHIHALDITTGADKVTPMLVAAAVQGNGNGGNGTTVPWVATQQLQRPALTLLNGVLYVAYSGYADVDPYHGWILGFNASNLQLVSVFNTTPNLLPGGTENTDGGQAGEGGIWMTGAGLASDGTSMFLLTGNGDFGVAQGDYGDSALKITPDSSTQANPNINGYGMSVTDNFTPFNQANLASADEDLGSGGGIVLPDQPGPFPHEYIGSGKSGVIYVINRDAMGGYNASTDTGRVIQEVNLGDGNFDTAAYFNETIYYQGVNGVLKAYTLTNGMLSAAPSAQATVPNSSGQGASPSISSNGTANGIVWNIQFSGSHEVLHAYDATTLQELYNSSQNATRDQLGAGVKFITPTIADGEVFVGGSGFVDVFGLLAPPTSPPAAPSNLAAAALSASQVQLTWVNNANNQAGFKIERSTDGTNFTQIAVAGASALSYSDTTASPSTTYYYRIRATNVIGDSANAGPVMVTTPAVTGAVDVYHFDAGSGTSAVDSVGTNSGTLTGTAKPTWVLPGKVGAAALSFTGNGAFNQAVGSQSAVTLTSDLSPILGGTSSLDAWFKTTQVAPSGSTNHWQDPAITGVEQSGGGNDINWGTINTTGHIGIYVGDSGGIYSTNAVNDGQWHNIAMTRNATTGAVQLYIDGVLNASGTFDTGNKTSQFFLIGALSDVGSNGTTPTGDNYFNGQLDEVRVYNQVLTANDVQGVALIPGAPTLATPTANPGPVVHLAWTTPSSFTQSIEIDRKTGATGTYAAIATVGGGVTSYDDQTVATGTQYYYVVKAIDLAGTSPASNEVNITVPMPTIVANSVFYNGSAFDGFNGSSNQTDTTSVATNKQALLPGQTATFQNVTSYSKGINGVIVDVANFYNLPRFEDFTFQVSADGVAWTQAPDPSIINLYPGRGPNGSTQITIIWDDNAIENEWLQVTVLADSHTGLANNDTFYFGNLIGATGANVTANSVTVGSTDVASITGDPHSLFNKASITNVNDINRDGQVNANDAVLARDSAGSTLPLFIAPAAGGGQAVAAATPGATTASTSSTTNSAAPPGKPSPASSPSGNVAASSTGSTTPGAVGKPVAPSLPGTSPFELPNSPRVPASVVGVPRQSSDSLAAETTSRALPARAAIAAVWNALDDTNHNSSWWSGGQIAKPAAEQIDELLGQQSIA